jgi:hypothetical protein
MPSFLRVAFLMAIIFLSSRMEAQKVLMAQVRDQHSEEPVPFASVRFIKSGAGRQADSSGSFIFHFTNWPSDTLEVTSVGFQDFKLAFQPLSSGNDTLHLVIHLIQQAGTGYQECQ